MAGCQASFISIVSRSDMCKRYRRCRTDMRICCVCEWYSGWDSLDFFVCIYKKLFFMGSTLCDDVVSPGLIHRHTSSDWLSTISDFVCSCHEGAVEPTSGWLFFSSQFFAWLLFVEFMHSSESIWRETRHEALRKKLIYAPRKPVPKTIIHCYYIGRNQ